MHPRLYRLSLVCATLLLSLASPLQLAGISLGNTASAQAQTSQDRKVEALRLNKAGIQQLNTSQFREALQTFEQAWGIFRAIGDRQGEGRILNNIGEVYRNLGQYADALKYYQQALAIVQQIGDKQQEGRTLNNIGLVHTNQGQYEDALKYYQQALNIGQQVGDKATEGATLNNIGLVYDYQGRYAEALKYYQQTLNIVQQIGDKATQGRTLSNIGLIYTNQGQYGDALKSYQQALAIVQQIGDKVTEGTILNNIGLVYGKQGQYEDALKFYQQALNIVQQIGEKATEGTTLSNIGFVYTNQGQYADALKSYQQALAIVQQIGDKAGEGRILNNIGLVYDSQGQYGEALKYYQQALVIAQQVGDKQQEGRTLNNIGTLYNYQGQYGEALKYYQQALNIVQQIGDKQQKGTTLSNIGLIYNYQGQYEDALKYYQQALVIAQQIGDKQHEGITLSNIGAAYHYQGQYGEALKYYQQALVIPQQIGDKQQEGATLNNIGAAYHDRGQYADAEKTLLAAIVVLESLRPGLTDTAKVSIFETQTQTYRLLQQALIAQNKTNTALEIAERGRARAFVELLASRQSSNPNIQQTVKSLNLQQIQLLAKEQNATLVEYSIVNDAFKNQGKEERRESGLYIWVVKPTGEVAFKQVDLKSLKTPLEDLVTNSRDSIGVRGLPIIGVVPRPGSQQKQEANQTENLQQLHKLLIEPIAQFLPTNPSDRVIFIPQNELFLVPFPALKDTSGKYLIEKHTILTAPAIQVLELTRKQRQQVAGKDVLVVGNPTMPSISPKLGQPPQPLPSLPGAEAEANTIAQLLNTKAITGKDATKAAIEHRMGKARIIHLATHGLLDNFKGDAPGAIALAPEGNDNGLLTSSEIIDLKLNAELVVLSACNTGQGNITGDGVIGLSRSLISAGVSSVIVSLWSVPDAPTAELMTQFYQNLSSNPDKAQALRNAMLTTLKQHPNPRNWAAFTLIGEAD